MKLLSLFRQPFDNDTLDSWAKNLDDIAKISTAAFPVLIYSGYGVLFKIINFILLCVTIYMSLGTARYLRNLKQ